MGFPGQVASLGEPVGAFVTAAFGGTRIDPAPMLRGVYLASGTQEGTPIDRLTGALSRAFGLDPRRPVGVLGQKGRSFFLGRLLREVVFNEARLAARDRNAERRRRLVAIGAWSVALLVTLGGLGWAYAAYTGEQRRAAALEEALAKAEGAGRTVRFDPVVDARPGRRAALSRCRAAIAGGGEDRRRRAWPVAGSAADGGIRGGLSPGAGPGAAAAAAGLARNPDQGQFPAPRLPVRGDAGLSHARPPGAARPWAGAGMAAGGLVARLPRRHRPAAAGGAAGPSRCAAGGRFLRLSAGWGAGRWRPAGVLPPADGGAGLFPAAAAGPAVAALVARRRRSARPASATSPALPAGR